MDLILQNQNHTEDALLVGAAQKGSSAALEKLLLRHHSFIYNIVLRMCGSRDDAEDATQEILIKVITKLSTFQGKSSFRTWLYRVVTNHVLNMKRSRREIMASSFDKHRNFLETIPDRDPGAEYDNDAQKKIMIEETKNQCLNGMLLCLERRDRLVFILGAIFAVSSSDGSKILEISAVNFRKILSRSRKKLQQYMNGNCGLLNKNNTCRCSNKARQLSEMSFIAPDNLTYPTTNNRRINAIIKKRSSAIKNMLLDNMARFFREQPFVESENSFVHIKEIIEKISSSWDSIDIN